MFTQNQGFEQPKVILKELENSECPSCKGIYYTQSFLIKKLPKLKYGLPKDQIVPVVVFRCDQCGEPRVDLLSDY